VSLSRLLHLLFTRALLSGVFMLISLSFVIEIPNAHDRSQVAFQLLSCVLWSMFAVLVMIRPAPVLRGTSLVGIAAALSAQFVFIGVGVLARQGASGHRVWIADLLLLCGNSFALASVAALGRCFGVLPDVRGLVMRGPYRVVRHPLYLGELTATFGLALGAQQVWLALAAWSACLGVQIVRTRYEELAHKLA
jgi:hypothetical protein